MFRAAISSSLAVGWEIVDCSRKCHLTVDTVEGTMYNVQWKAKDFLFVEGNIHNFLRYPQTICAFKEALVFSVTGRPRATARNVCRIELPSRKHVSWPLMA